MAVSTLIRVGEDYKEKYGFFDPEKFVFKAKRGLTEEVVKEISWMKQEPGWMTAIRLRADLLPDEPGHNTDRGRDDDRQRVHRAVHQGTAAGVRGGAQPADPSGDGGLGRMNPPTKSAVLPETRRVCPG